jgi:hypothetical protein
VSRRSLGVSRLCNRTAVEERTGGAPRATDGGQRPQQDTATATAQRQVGCDQGARSDRARLLDAQSRLELLAVGVVVPQDIGDGVGLEVFSRSDAAVNRGVGYVDALVRERLVQ